MNKQIEHMGMGVFPISSPLVVDFYVPGDHGRNISPKVPCTTPLLWFCKILIRYHKTFIQLHGIT